MKRAVVITGVSGGIGLATAALFHERGWFVIGIDLEEPSPQPSEIDLFIQSDVADAESWKTIECCIREQTNLVHSLVNNAAIQICKPLVETAPEAWDRTMSVNVRGMYLGIRELHSLMDHSESAIVNVSSVHAVATSPRIAAYAASKGAVAAMTRALALELGPQTRVNAVLPGAVDTSMLREGLKRGNQQVEALGKQHALERVGQPKDIAEAIYFLSEGDRASFITGHSLVVDGGATIRLSTE